MITALFGIENDSAALVVNLLVFFLVVVWLALVYYTYADAKRRIEDPLLIGCATAASLFPFVGTIVYVIVRPPEYLEDVRERELEIKGARARLSSLDYQECPNCGAEVERTFLRCPQCTKKLRQPCAKCAKPLSPGWKLCPYCETPVGQRPARRRRAPARDKAAAAKAPAPQRPAAGGRASTSDPGEAAPTTPER